MLSTKWIVWGVSCFAVLGIAAQPYRPMVVVGRSMAPTYASGEVLLTAPVDRPLRRGDVVVADGPDGPIVKRVALLPGDRRTQWQYRGRGGWTDMTDFPRVETARCRKFTRVCTVPAGTVYLLGDNLGISVDSRNFGPIPIERVRRIVVDAREAADASEAAREFPRRWIVDAIRAGAKRWGHKA